MKRALSRREQRKEATRRRLIEEANRLFLEQGFEATTVEAIADAADVAKGTFFNYFENKERVLVAILHSRIEEAVQDELPTLLPTMEQLYVLLERVYDNLLPYCRMLPHLMMHTILPGRGRGKGSRHHQPLRTRVLRLLQEGQQRGDIRSDVCVETGSRFIVVYFFHTVFEQCLSSRRSPLQKQLQKGLDILFHGMLRTEK